MVVEGPVTDVCTLENQPYCEVGISALRHQLADRAQDAAALVAAGVSPGDRGRQFDGADP
jgi:hypothetical protein